MGSWGYKVNENDDYYDLTCGVLHDLTKIIKRAADQKTGHSRYYNEARAAIHMLVLLGTSDTSPVRSSDLDLAEKALQRILKDEKWLEEWLKPEIAELEIAKELQAVQAARIKS